MIARLDERLSRAIEESAWDLPSRKDEEKGRFLGPVAPYAMTVSAGSSPLTCEFLANDTFSRAAGDDATTREFELSLSKVS